MSTSITASTQTPYSLPLLQDVNYNVSAAYAATDTSASTSAVNFANFGWPVSGKILLSVYSTAATTATGTSSYVGLQWSSDNSTWTNVTTVSSSVVVAGAAAVSQLVSLPPPQTTTANYYVRAVGTTTGIGISGSFGFNTLF